MDYPEAEHLCFDASVLAGFAEKQRSSGQCSERTPDTCD
jgi:hypothetical protein